MSDGLVLRLDVVSSMDIFVAILTAALVLAFCAVVVWRVNHYLERRDEERALADEAEEWVHGLPHHRYLD